MTPPGRLAAECSRETTRLEDGSFAKTGVMHIFKIGKLLVRYLALLDVKPYMRRQPV